VHKLGYRFPADTNVIESLRRIQLWFIEHGVDLYAKAEAAGMDDKMSTEDREELCRLRKDLFYSIKKQIGQRELLKASAEETRAAFESVTLQNASVEGLINGLEAELETAKVRRRSARLMNPSQSGLRAEGGS
jgi:cell wall assembly regulator SMI1